MIPASRVKTLGFIYSAALHISLSCNVAFLLVFHAISAAKMEKCQQKHTAYINCYLSASFTAAENNKHATSNIIRAIGIVHMPLTHAASTYFMNCSLPKISWCKLRMATHINQPDQNAFQYDFIKPPFKNSDNKALKPIRYASGLPPALGINIYASRIPSIFR